MIHRHTTYDTPRMVSATRPFRLAPGQLTWEERTYYPPVPDPKEWRQQRLRQRPARRVTSLTGEGH